MTHDTQDLPETRADPRWTVRRRLRHSTRSEHARLGRHPMLAGITEKGFPLFKYRAILGAYYRFHAAVEPAILTRIAEDGVPFAYLERRKLPWLLNDIAALGDVPPAESAQVSVILPANFAELIGVLYAVEGATLGGQLISRCLSQHMGLTASNGARYFAAYGPDTEARWESFCSFAEGLAAFPACCAEAATTARRTFQCIENLLDEYPRRQP